MGVANRSGVFFHHDLRSLLYGALLVLDPAIAPIPSGGNTRIQPIGVHYTYGIIILGLATTSYYIIRLTVVVGRYMIMALVWGRGVD